MRSNRKWEVAALEKVAVKAAHFVVYEWGAQHYEDMRRFLESDSYTIDRGALRGDRPLRVDRRGARLSRVRLLGGEGAMRLAGKPYGLTKGERRFGIAAGIVMFALAVLAAL